MIAELAAFNAAFATVKATINAGRDIMSCANSIGDMIGAEEQIKARGDRKKSSIWSQLAGKDTNDFEEFMALEQIREQRKDLIQALQLYGRPGLKDDFVRFEAEARKKRRAQAVAAEKKKQKILEWTVGIVAVLVGLVGLAIALWLIGKGQGKW